MRALLIGLTLLTACSAEPLQLRWSEQIGGADFRGHATGGDIAFAPDGGVLATTTLQGPVRFDDSTTIDGGATITQARDAQRPYGAVSRFGPDGALRWTRPAMTGCAGVDIKAITRADDAGHVYLASARLSLPNALCLSRYDSEGEHLWSRELFGAIDVPRLTALDGERGVILAGRYAPEYFLPEELERTLGPTPAPGPDEALNMIARFDPEGALVWLRVTTARVKAVDRDDEGGVFVAGDITAPTGSLGGEPLAPSEDIGRALVLARYDADGAHLWSRAFDPGVAHDLPLHLDATSGGDALLAGYFQDRLDLGTHVITGSGRVFAARFDATGEVRWARALQGLHQLSGAALWEAGAVLVGDTPAPLLEPHCKRLELHLLDVAGEAPGNGPAVRHVHACARPEGPEAEAQVVLNLDGIHATPEGRLALVGTFAGALRFDDGDVAHHTARRSGQALGAAQGARMAAMFHIPAMEYPTVELAWAAFVAVYSAH